MPLQRRRSLPSNQTRRGRPSQSHDDPLTKAEIQRERLLLAQDMVHLVLEDGQTLPAEAQQTLQAFAQALLGLRRDLRDWS